MAHAGGIVDGVADGRVLEQAGGSPRAFCAQGVAGLWAFSTKSCYFHTVVHDGGELIVQQVVVQAALFNNATAAQDSVKKNTQVLESFRDSTVQLCAASISSALAASRAEPRRHCTDR